MHFFFSPLKGTIKVNKTEEEIREIFKGADEDGNGALSKEELQHAFRQLGAHVPAWRANRGLRHADNNHDGAVNLTGDELNDLIKYARTKYGYKVRK